MLRTARSGVGALVLLAILLAGCGGKSATPATTAVAAKPRRPRSFEQVVAEVRSGIVKIQAGECNGTAIGTGFLVAPGLVATVEHVVDGATSVTLKQNGKTVGFGTVVGSDQARDLALVRSDRPIRGHTFALAGRAPALGEDVSAIGFPLDLPLTVTRGSVSGTDRTIAIDGLNRHGLVQTDAAVNPGNSGGPLITDSGTVVGLVDLGTTQANGLAFAVSSLVAKPLLQAWRTAPQPVAPTTCAPATPQSAQAAPSPTTTPTTETYNGTDFSIVYPAGFTVTAAEVNKGTYFDTTIQEGSYLIRVDENPVGGSGSVDAAAAPVLHALQREAGYRQISLVHTTFAGFPALRWEFEVPEHGVLLHKVDTFFIGDHSTEWGVLVQAPASAWPQVSDGFAALENTFVEK